MTPNIYIYIYLRGVENEEGFTQFSGLRACSCCLEWCVEKAEGGGNIRIT